MVWCSDDGGSGGDSSSSGDDDNDIGDGDSDGGDSDGGGGDREMVMVIFVSHHIKQCKIYTKHKTM